jgi:pimeloyl-ACP methyl ester carboxylesterase
MSAGVPEPNATIDVVSVDGARLRVRRHGNPRGPRLMLSHGNGFAIDGYFRFWSRFLEDFEVIVFDMRSHGQNPRAGPPNHDYAHMVQDFDAMCHAVADEFGRKPTAGLFHSMSAQCAMLQAREARSDFAALVLFDPPDVPPPGHPVRGRMKDYEHKLALWARQRRTHFDDPGELASDYASTRSGQRWAEGAAEQMARAVLQPDPAGGWRLACPTELEAAMYLEVISLGLWPKRRDFVMRVKLIGADPDKPYPAATALSNRALAAEGGFDYAVIPGTTHLLQLEEPAACAEAAIEFLSQGRFQ